MKSYKTKCIKCDIDIPRTKAGTNGLGLHDGCHACLYCCSFHPNTPLRHALQLFLFTRDLFFSMPKKTPKNKLFVNVEIDIMSWQEFIPSTNVCFLSLK